MDSWGEWPEHRSVCNNGESRRDDISIDDREVKESLNTVGVVYHLLNISGRNG